MGGIIGVFDSGVGGLTVFRELKRELPQAKLIYLGDTARTPYGSKGPETIKRYSKECAAFLLSRGITELVVACNTASSHALPELAELCGEIPVFGTIIPSVETALEVSRGGTILVLGTKSTVASGAFGKELAKRTQLKIVQQACPLFVPLVEEGITEGPLVSEAIDLYLGNFKNSGIDTVILGCTHYPLLREALQHYFGPQVTLVDCATTLAKSVSKNREFAQIKLRSSVPADEFFVTDDPSSFGGLAARILNNPDVTAERVMDLAA